MGNVLDQRLGLVGARGVAVGAHRALPAVAVRAAFAGTGMLGAYTTFSTFSVETDVLVKDGHAGTALAYVVASLVLGIVAAWFGVVAARKLVPV